MFVRKVHVLDPHQPAGLCHSGEETIEDSCRHERLEVCRCAAPSSHGDCQGQEVEQDRQTSEVCGESDNDETSGTNHELIANEGVVDGRKGGSPLRGLWE